MALLSYSWTSACLAGGWIALSDIALWDIWENNNSQSQQAWIELKATHQLASHFGKHSSQGSH